MLPLCKYLMNQWSLCGSYWDFVYVIVPFSLNDGHWTMNFLAIYLCSRCLHRKENSWILCLPMTTIRLVQNFASKCTVFGGPRSLDWSLIPYSSLIGRWSPTHPWLVADPLLIPDCFHHNIIFHWRRLVHAYRKLIILFVSEQFFNKIN